MNTPKFDEISIGDTVPSLELAPLSRLTLALYCGASGDHNPIHVDTDYARNEAGMDDVVGHGSLTMAYLGRLLTNWVPQTAIRYFKVRLLTPTHVGDKIICTGKVIGKSDKKDNEITVELQANSESGTCLAAAQAIIDLSL